MTIFAPQMLGRSFAPAVVVAGIGNPVGIGSQTGTTGTSLVITTTGTAPANSVIVVAVSDNVGTCSGVADGTNTYTQRVVRTSLTNHYLFSTGILAGSLASGSSITVSLTSISNDAWASAAYVTGLSTATPDLTADSATLSTTTATLAQANEIVFGSTTAYNGGGVTGSFTQTSGFTDIQQTNNFGSDKFSFDLAYKIVAATTGVNYAVTVSGSSTLRSQVMVALKG